VKHIQVDNHNFKVRVILTGLKIAGKPHIKQMIQNLVDSHEFANIIGGFDLVNEEDFSAPVLEFINELHDKRLGSTQNPVHCFLTAGQTHDKANENIYDAILLNSKRIAHGFQLSLHPHLQTLVRKNNICIEACPISNMLLGFTNDLRSHPVRFLMTKGIQATINSNVPGLFGYQGVTLDYAYAFLAWDLDILDLKKLSLNGIVYSSNTEGEKKEL
jgi:adenosine deaminase CECR1